MHVCSRDVTVGEMMVLLAVGMVPREEDGESISCPASQPGRKTTTIAITKQLLQDRDGREEQPGGSSPTSHINLIEMFTSK